MDFETNLTVDEDLNVPRLSDEEDLDSEKKCRIRSEGCSETSSNPGHALFTPLDVLIAVGQ